MLQWTLLHSPMFGLAGLSDTIVPTNIQPVYSLLKEFNDIFSGPSDPHGFCNINPLRIETTGPPLSQRAYRTPLTKRNTISKAIDDMLAEGVIQPSRSPWASPVTLVPKSDGSTRFCVDYRRLNSVTKKFKFPLPNIQDIFYQIGNSKVFTTLDLKSGYFQLPMHPGDMEKQLLFAIEDCLNFVEFPLDWLMHPLTSKVPWNKFFMDLLANVL